MTKSELIERLCTANSQLATKDVELSVKAILDQMVDTLATGDRIEIRGFGSFLYITVNLELGVILSQVKRLN